RVVLVGGGAVRGLRRQWGVAPGTGGASGPGATEPRLPLAGPGGRIVSPGSPADVLFSFRLYSVAAQLLLWATIGLVFAPLAGRLLRPPPAAARPRQPQDAAPV